MNKKTSSGYFCPNFDRTFSIVNGLLTGTLIKNQVVWYNNNENLSIRLGTIPVEDIFYALLMLLMVMIGYQISLNNNNKSKLIS